MKTKLLKFIALLSCTATLVSCGGEPDYPVVKTEVDYTETSTDFVGTPKSNRILMDYSDSYFKTKATSEDIPLDFARISMGLALIAHPSTSSITTVTPNHVKYFFQGMGYENIIANSSFNVSNNDEDSVGLCFGYKKIGDYNTIAVGIKGFMYKTEWAGNFKIGTSEECVDHLGFYNAAKKAESEIRNYIQSLSLSNNAKLRLWTSGYSRGGGISTLLGRILDDEREEGKLNLNLAIEDQYSFAYDAPVTSGKENKDLYNNIHTFNNKNDIVTRVMPSEYGFYKVGRIHYINDFVTHDKFVENLGYYAFNATEKHFTPYHVEIDTEGEEMFVFTEDTDSTKTVGDYYNDLLTLLLTVKPEDATGLDISTRDNYANNIQFALTDVIKFAFNLSSLELLALYNQVKDYTKDDLQEIATMVMFNNSEELKNKITGILNGAKVKYSEENLDKIVEQVLGVANTFIGVIFTSSDMQGYMDSIGTIAKNYEYVIQQHLSQVNLCYFIE